MTSNVNSIITSGDLGGGLIPTEYATQIIQDAPKSSVSLTRMRQIRMSTRTRTQPVLDSKPIAYWVGGDTGLKQTTKMKWSGLSITAEELAEINGLGARASFTGIITYKSAGEMRRAMLAQGLGRLMLETDCPYLAPVPLRGSVNEPANIPLIARAAAEIFGVSEEYLADAVRENSRGFFGI